MEYFTENALAPMRLFIGGNALLLINAVIGGEIGHAHLRPVSPKGRHTQCDVMGHENRTSKSRPKTARNSKLATFNQTAINAGFDLLPYARKKRYW